MDNRDQKTFFYRRKIVDLENKYQDEIAGAFIDKRVRQACNRSQSIFTLRTRLHDFTFSL